MSRLLKNHSLGSALRRLSRLVRGVGLGKTISLMVSYVDDQHLKFFDRRYGVKTSGYISLASTSFAADRLADATNYGPVNGWAFRKLLKDLNLPKVLHFVDLGCGLGRACILAVEYGFDKVTGVELAADLCSMAKKNIAACRLPAARLSAIEIRQMDALEFCAQTDGDVFFMYRPFTWTFLLAVLAKLAERAASLGKPLIIIYSERMMHDDSYARAFSGNPAFRKLRETGMYGQAFFVYECGTRLAKAETGRPEKSARA